MRTMSRFEDWLAGQSLDIAVRTYAAGTRTAGDAAHAIGCEVAQIVESLVFIAGDRPVVTLVSGARLAELAGARVEELA
jgi:prolyl-tRNA editing enzyme YbaK/EbsC (Cys-tRNA(Pro) deacylase)